ncbi:MAG TPA: DUF1036 domain-containing protein [Polyangiales bacterium]
MKYLRWFAFMSLMIGAVALAPSAHAWTKVKNNTPNTISLAYAFSSVSGVGCGYSTCGGGWKSKGWWNIAPGGTVTINGQAHHNADHQYYAQDTQGRKWRGGGRAFELRNTPFDFCNQGLFPGTWQEVFKKISGSRCCGFWCSPVNWTETLIL